MNALQDTFLLGYRRPGASRAPLVDDSTRDPICPETGGVLEAVYDLDAAGAALDRDSFDGGARMCSWRALLPVRDPAKVCSLDEGGTPLLHNRRLGEALGLQCLYLKDESRNPTGSFKDRGSSVTVSKCREVGHRGLTVASSGNLACSLSSYAAAAGLEFHGFVRDDTTATNLLHGLISQQHFYIVPGDMLEGIALAAAVAKRYHFFHAAQPYNLFRVEGKKTLAFEICAQLGWRAPDRVLVPTSGCTNALALHKGFSELRALGWIATVPAIDLVQAEGCAPVVDAFEAGAPVARSRGPGTALFGMGHPRPSAGAAHRSRSMSASARYALGIDVGGTHTDIELVAIGGSESYRHKIASTPDDPARAVTEGAREILALSGIAPEQIVYFAHSTTVATNALVQGRTASTALVTTRGFRDVLEIRRQRRPHLYNLRVEKPAPPVPRHLRYEIGERHYLFGRDDVEPDPREIESLAAALAAAGVEAVAVCYLHSYDDPTHERSVGAQLRQALPGVFVCLSSDVVPEPHEYERTSTTAINACLVLGHLSRSRLLAGRLPLDIDAARRAIGTRIAEPLSMSVEDAAVGMLTLLNENMVQAVRVISVERGFDPRCFALVAFGGAGPLLAGALARELAIETVLIPPCPGLLCAQGLLVADERADFARSRVMILDASRAAEFDTILTGLEAQATSWFDAGRIPREDRRLTFTADLRYDGQSHQLRVGVERAREAGSIRAVLDAFHAEHRREYGFETDAPVEAVTFRVTARAATHRIDVSRSVADASSGQGATVRSVRFVGATDAVQCPVVPRATLRPGTIAHGPLVVEQMDATTVVAPGERLEIDGSGVMVLRVAPAG